MNEILKRIEEIIDTFDAITMEYNDAPVAGSQMEQEIAAYPDKPRINEPFTFARLNLKAGREQLVAMPDLIRGQKIFTNPVAARAALESAALACWLLEPGITAKERVTRGMILLCYGKDQLRRYYNDAGDVAEVAKIDDFMNNNLPTMVASNSITLRPKPSIVDLIRDNLGADFRHAYRTLSGFAHGQYNTLITFAYDFDNAAAGAGGVKMLVYKPKDSIQLYSFQNAVGSFQKALEAYFTITGWDFGKIKPAFDGFFVELAEAIKNNKK